MSEDLAAPKRRAPGLGRGLSALLGDASSTQEAANDGIREVPIADIFPDPDQPRNHFDEDALDELAASIRKHGILQPIVVRPTGGGGYRIVAGERRWRAAQRVQMHHVPVIIKEFDDGVTLEVALLENIQRTDLNAIEEGLAYRRLINQFNHTQEALSAIVHKSRSHIANLIRLLDLPERVRGALAAGQISMGHARALLGAPDPEGLTKEIVEKGLSVRDVERMIKRGKCGEAAPIRANAAPVAGDEDIAMLERQLGDLLGLKVAIAHKGGAGSVTLNYATLDQLDMICQRLSGEKI
jgi:ParB family transcriptional regulator, chromosome partitioning protein